jgi:chromosome segregation ATPase
MGISIPTLQSALAVALATIPALLTVLWSIWQHNKRIEDIRDTLRAEIIAKAAELAALHPELHQKLGNIDYRFGRIEEDIRAIRGLFAEIQAGSSKVNQAINVAFSEQRLERERGQRNKEDLGVLQKTLDTGLKRLEDLEAKLKAEFRKDMENLVRLLLKRDTD